MNGATLPGVLLVRGDARAATSWVRHGVTPSYVIPSGVWSAVVPAGAALARPPYDDALQMMAGRPVAWRLRPALGVFALRDHAVVVAHPRGMRALSRWLVWFPGRGPSPIPGMPEARLADLVRVAGVTTDRHVHDVLHDRSGSPLDFCANLLAALTLPGAALLRGKGVKDAAGATLVEPDQRSVERFDKVTADEESMRRELEENL